MIKEEEKKSREAQRERQHEEHRHAEFMSKHHIKTKELLENIDEARYELEQLQKGRSKRAIEWL